MKDFVVHHKVQDIEICKSEFNNYCVETFKIAQPFSAYFRGPVYDVLESE